MQPHSQSSTRYHAADPPTPQPGYSHAQPQYTRSGPTEGQEGGSYPSYLSMATGPKTEQQQPQHEEEEEEAQEPKTEGLLKSRKAVLPSEIRRREKSTEDPRRGRGEEEQGVPRAQSLGQGREAESEDSTRRGYGGRSRQRWEDEADPVRPTEHVSRLQAAKSRARERENAIYIHRGLAATHIQPKVAHTADADSSSSTKPISQSLSDIRGPRGPSQRALHHQAPGHSGAREGAGFQPTEEGVSNGEGHQDSRISVAQLRHSYLESTTTNPAAARRPEL